MKSLTKHVTERLHLTKDRVHTDYKYFPQTSEELKEIIKNITKQHSTDNIIDLNMIDTSQITNMDLLFAGQQKNYDVSKWDVSNVKRMRSMFYECKRFNCDLSQWDVSNVKDMLCMFAYCNQFQGNGLKYWDVSNVENMRGMFIKTLNFNENISTWNISHAENISFMFSESIFNQDISSWDISNIINLEGIFRDNKVFNKSLKPWKNKIKYKDQLQYIQKYI